MRPITLAALFFAAVAATAWGGDNNSNPMLGMTPPPTDGSSQGGASPGAGAGAGAGRPDNSGGGFRSLRSGSGNGAGNSSMNSTPNEDAPPDANQAPAAATLADARDNMASLVETYVATRGRNGMLALKTTPKGPARPLRLQGIEKGSIHELGAGRFSAVVLFRDKAGHGVSARAEADFSGSDWHVISISTARPAKKDKEDKDDKDGE